MGWSDTTNNWSPLSVTAHAQVKGSNVQIVGLSDGQVGEFQQGTFTDLGVRVPAQIDTGFLSRGTDRRKHCRVVRLVLRKVGASGQISLQYRGSEGAWSAPLTADLARDGVNVIEFRSLGVYRRRQWRFSFHGTAEIALASASEEFEPLTQ
jgi:hypothetical protein